MTTVDGDAPRDTQIDADPAAAGPPSAAPAGASEGSDTVVDDPPSMPVRHTLPDIVAEAEPGRTTLPDIEQEPTVDSGGEAGDEGDGDGAPDETAEPQKKKRSWLYFAIGALFLLAVTGPLAFYFLVFRYRPTAPHHIPSGTTLAVRFDGRELYVYEPFRKHILGALDGSEKVAGRFERFNKHTGVDLRNDVREVIFATKTTETWIVLIGGNFGGSRGKGKFVKGVKAFLDEEGMEGYSVDGDVLRGPLLRIAQAEDTTILIANDDEILRAATEPSDTWQDLGLASSGAISFAITRDAFGKVAEDPGGRLPPFLGPLAPEQLEHLGAASRGTLKATGYLDLGNKGPRFIADVVPASGTAPEDLSERWELVRAGASAQRERVSELDTTGLSGAVFDAKLKPRAKTVMVTVKWDRKEFDAALEKAGAAIREALGR